MTTAEIQTPKGTMMVSFFEADAPGTVDNFITLAKKGYYDGLGISQGASPILLSREAARCQKT